MFDKRPERTRKEVGGARRYEDMKDQIKGKAEELKGKMTGDRSEEAEGKARQKMGDAKAKARDVKEDVRDEWHKHTDENPAREPGPDDDTTR
jgi:uncharacterized protein YjbJ (UPF0337 family)